MSYKIEYLPAKTVPQEKQHTSLRIRTLTAAFALAGCITARAVCPEGAQLLSRVLLPGEPSPGELAFAQMMTQLRSGESVGDCVTVFCKQILDNGNELYPKT